jgi:hypothetical protein
MLTLHDFELMYLILLGLVLFGANGDLLDKCAVPCESQE